MAPAQQPLLSTARGILATALVAGGQLAAALLRDPRRDFLGFLAAMAAAGAGWVWLLRAAHLGRMDRRDAATLIALAAALDALAVARPPGLSDDVFRHVYEGRVVWVMGPAFPFLHPPELAPRLGVPLDLLDAAWLRINHADIASIYPPLAALVFALAAGAGDLAGGHHLLVLKALLAGAGLAAVAVLRGAIDGPARAEAAVLALASPLVFEAAREGHADALAVLGLAVLVRGFARDEHRLGAAGLGLATLAKLNGVALLPAAARATRRGLWIALLAIAVSAVPFALAGLGATSGLPAYASVWRAGDGAFSLISGMVEAMLGGSWRRIGPWTVTRDAVARILAAAVFGLAAVAILRRPFAPRDVPERAGLLLLLLLLLAPTLHPWYLAWLLPFIPFARAARRAMIALILLSPLLHHPAWLELLRGEWTDLWEIRAMVHVPVWLLLGRDLVRAPRLG